jgi:hypothetical protein
MSCSRKAASFGWNLITPIFQIFFKARGKAKEELNEQLADFQQKRTAGLGTIFGPPEAQLDESIHDKSKEMKIVENILIPKMEGYL